MTADPLHLLDAAVRAHTNGERLPVPVQDWLTSALVEYIERGRSLNESLGLLNGARRRYARAVRDSHIRAAYAQVGDVKRLAGRIRRFRQGRWPLWCKTGLGASADEVSMRLYKAFSTGEFIPESVKQLRRIVRDTTAETAVPE